MKSMPQIPAVLQQTAPQIIHHKYPASRSTKLESPQALAKATPLQNAIQRVSTHGPTLEKMRSLGNGSSVNFEKITQAHNLPVRTYSTDVSNSTKDAVELNLTPLLPTIQKAKCAIIDDFTALNIIKLFTSQKQNLSLDDFTSACAKAQFFFEDNGIIGNSLFKRVSQITHHFIQHPELIDALEKRSPLEITRQLNIANIKKYSIPFRLVIKNSNRLDKRVTGLGHTLIQSKDGRWFELLKTCDTTNFHDILAIGKHFNSYFVPQDKVTLKKNSTKDVNLILGSGSFGIVVPIQDILNQKIYAAKKLINLDSSAKEYNAGQFLKEVLGPEARKHFIFPEVRIESTGSQSEIDFITSKKSFITKDYLISEFAIEQDEADTIDDILDSFYLSHDSQKFEKDNFEQISLFVNKTLFLEQHNLTHTDLKPENIFGKKIGDCGDIVKNNIQIKSMVFTPDYTLPAVNTKEKLSDIELKTYNRFSLGAMIFLSVTGKIPSDEKLHDSLKLPREIESTSNRKGKDLFYQRGYNQEQLTTTPTTLFTRDQVKYQVYLSAYEKAVLTLAKKLMAEDRSIPAPDNMDLGLELEKLKLLIDSST